MNNALEACLKNRRVERIYKMTLIAFAITFPAICVGTLNQSSTLLHMVYAAGSIVVFVKWTPLLWQRSEDPEEAQLSRSVLSRDIILAAWRVIAYLLMLGTALYMVKQVLLASAPLVGKMILALANQLSSFPAPFVETFLGAMLGCIVASVFISGRR